MKYATSLLLSTGLYYPLRRAFLAVRNRGASAQSVFTDIWQNNRWGSDESKLGEGSSIAQTVVLTESLLSLLRRHGVHTMLDIPCGDFHRMSQVPLDGIGYVGADIVESLVARNSEEYGFSNRSFTVADLCSSPLPQADLVFCRDCMVHLPFEMVADALTNVRRSCARLLMATTFPATTVNHDITVGDFRPINLQLPPFNFPPPLELLVEHCIEANGLHAHKAMGVWRVTDLTGYTMDEAQQ